MKRVLIVVGLTVAAIIGGAYGQVFTTMIIQGVGARQVESVKAASGNTITTGTYSSLPGTCNAGDTFVTSDSPHGYICNGSNSFIAYNGFQGPPLTSWTTSGFTWANQNSWTASTPDRDPILTCASSCTDGNTGDQIAGFYSGAALSIPYTYTAHFTPTIVQNSSSNLNGNEAFGIIIKQSGTGHLIHYGIFIQSSTAGNVPTASAALFTSETQHTGIVTIFQYPHSIGVSSYGYWVRMANNSTNRTYSYSLNGIDWELLFSEASGTNITENTSGVGVYMVGSTSVGGMVRYDSRLIQ